MLRIYTASHILGGSRISIYKSPSAVYLLPLQQGFWAVIDINCPPLCINDLANENRRLPEARLGTRKFQGLAGLLLDSRAGKVEYLRRQLGAFGDFLR